jgi:hypothetical protein
MSGGFCRNPAYLFDSIIVSVSLTLEVMLYSTTDAEEVRGGPGPQACSRGRQRSRVVRQSRYYLWWWGGGEQGDLGLL